MEVEKRQAITPYNVLILFLGGLGSISYGYSASIIATTLGQPSFIEYFDLATAHNGTDLISAMNGLFQAGAFFGTLIVPWIADKWGRKAALGLAAVVIIVSGALLTGSVHVAMFIVFRFTAGFGAYMMIPAVAIWMSEVVPPKRRGGLMDINAICYEFGFMVASWIGYGFYFWQSNNGNEWRPPLAIQCLWPLLLLLCLPWIPESPRWLIMKGRLEEAKRILIRLHSRSKNLDHSFALAELYQIQKQVDVDSRMDTSWLAMFRTPATRKRCFLSMGTMAIIQCSGVLVINNYSTLLYSSLGYAPQQQILYQAGWITMAFGLAIMAVPLIDMFPRPGFMATGIAICMACLIVEAAIIANYVDVAVPSTNEAALRAGVAMFFIYQIGYDIFIDGVAFVYISEIFPTHLRAKGTCLGVATLALVNIMWLQAAPTAFAHIGWKFYLAFIIPCSLGGILIYLVFPDTNGMPLEEIAALFGDAEVVAIYQREIELNPQTNVIIDHHDEKIAQLGETTAASAHLEKHTV